MAVSKGGSSPRVASTNKVIPAADSKEGASRRANAAVPPNSTGKLVSKAIRIADTVSSGTVSRIGNKAPAVNDCALAAGISVYEEVARAKI